MSKPPILESIALVVIGILIAIAVNAFFAIITWPLFYWGYNEIAAGTGWTMIENFWKGFLIWFAAIFIFNHIKG